MDAQNPGEELKEYLQSLHVFTNEGFLGKIDVCLRSDEDTSVARVFYDSCINYLVRRLMGVARYFFNIFTPKVYDEIRYKNEIRRYLKEKTRYNEGQRDKIALLLFRCIEAAQSELSDNDKRLTRVKAQRQGRRCYICGVELDYRDEKSSLYPSVDHKWPRSLGGLKSPSNLEVLCKGCNNSVKQNFINHSDYHFEHICLSSRNYDDFKRNCRRNRPNEVSVYEAAVLAKTEYQCAVCGKSAYRIGELTIGRIDKGDSWHFLNLQPYCVEHTPEE
jgi:5-methylcytosine-specific restriction endonuclease McrA